MTKNRLAHLAIGDRVTVYSFGRHVGVIASLAPTVTVQGRTTQPFGWLGVRLDDGRDWNGDHKAVDFGSAAPRKQAA